MPKWQNQPSRATIQGMKTLAMLSRQALIHMPWVIACCHAGCLLFTKGMNTRMGQKAACGANGGIMDHTKSCITPEELEEQILKLMAFNPWS